MHRDRNWRDFKSEIFYKRRLKKYFSRYVLHYGIWINDIKYKKCNWIDLIGTKEGLKLKYQSFSTGGFKQKYSGKKHIYDRSLSKNRESLGDRRLDKKEFRKILMDYEIG